MNFELGNNYLANLGIFCLDIHFLCHNFRILDLKMARKKRSVLLTKARAASTAKKNERAPSATGKSQKRKEASDVATPPRKKQKFDDEESVDDVNTPGTVDSKNSVVSESTEGTPAYVSGKKQASVPESDEEDELEVPHAEQPGANRPRKDLFEVDKEKSSRSAVRSIVSYSVFPRVKFCDSVRDLRYKTEDKTICKFVMERLSISESVDKRDFWEKAKKWVKATITRLRSTKSTELRYAFHGKWPDFHPSLSLS